MYYLGLHHAHDKGPLDLKTTLMKTKNHQHRLTSCTAKYYYIVIINIIIGLIISIIINIIIVIILPRRDIGKPGGGAEARGGEGCAVRHFPDWYYFLTAAENYVCPLFFAFIYSANILQSTMLPHACACVWLFVVNGFSVHCV